MKISRKKILICLSILLIIVFWIALFYYINPQKLVAKLGARNGYMIIFLLGTFGGVSVFTGPSYFIALSSLTIGGLNPFVLALIGSIGVTIGDTIILFLGLKAGKKFPDKFKDKREKLRIYLEKKPKRIIPLLVYAYIGFTPFPNEFITIPLGLTGYKLKKIIPIMFLGNITSGLIFAITGFYGLKYFKIV